MKKLKVLLLSAVLIFALVGGYVYIDKDMHILKNGVYSIIEKLPEGRVKAFAGEAVNGIAAKLGAETDSDKDAQALFIQWKDRIGAAQSSEEAAQWFNKVESGDKIDLEYHKYHDRDVSIESVHKCLEYEGKDIVFLKVTVDGEKKEWIYTFDVCEDGYRYYHDEELFDEIVPLITCPACGGTGQIMSGHGTVCGICGGSGQQYIPNLYYDGVMWQGGYIGCGGCGGSGYTGTTWSTCLRCSGSGIRY